MRALNEQNKDYQRCSVKSSRLYTAMLRPMLIPTIALLMVMAAPQIGFSQSADDATEPASEDAAETDSAPATDSKPAEETKAEPTAEASPEAAPEPAEEIPAVETVEEAPNEREETTTIAPVHVIGADPRDLLEVPGAADVITAEEIKRLKPTSLNEVVRGVAGVHVVEEEGIGLRPNVGFRGMDPDRSRSVLVLEDGIPIATLPYGGADLYYAPPMERISGIEIIKGSGSILHGPQTVGGVINYLTPEPPEKFTVTGEGRWGTHDYWMGKASVGDRNDFAGYYLQATHLRFGGFRNLNLKMSDALAKIQMNVGPTSTIGMKLNVYQENSNATYLGLSQDQFISDPSLNGAIHDYLPLQRYGASVWHKIFLGDSALLQTTAYGHIIDRKWRRQDLVRRLSDIGADQECERVFTGLGNTLECDSEFLPEDPGSSTESHAIYFLNSNGSRNRLFKIGGLETRLVWDQFWGDNIANTLKTGARVHFESAEIQYLNGTWHKSDAGEIRDQETRSGKALSLYLLDQLTLWDSLRISPGARMELYWANRHIDRNRNDEGVPADRNPAISQDSFIRGIIPGLGISYDVIPELSLFAGMHRGFAPPRVQDAITNEGDDLELDAEYSWDYEAGLRLRVDNYLRGEIAGFYMDFSNQIIEPSEAGGAVSMEGFETGLLNAGATEHIGVESNIQFDPAALANWSFSLPLELNYTFTQATFSKGWSDLIDGYRLPYAPEHMLDATVGFAHQSGFDAHVRVHFLSEQYTDLLNEPEATADGLRGEIGARAVVDAKLSYTYAPAGLTAYVVGKNLSDERYIASRRPRGIQPGPFRQILAGLSGEW